MALTGRREVGRTATGTRPPRGLGSSFRLCLRLRFALGLEVRWRLAAPCARGGADKVHGAACRTSPAGFPGRFLWRYVAAWNARHAADGQRERPLLAFVAALRLQRNGLHPLEVQRWLWLRGRLAPQHGHEFPEGQLHWPGSFWLEPEGVRGTSQRAPQLQQEAELQAIALGHVNGQATKTHEWPRKQFGQQRHAGKGSLDSLRRKDLAAELCPDVGDAL
mmetsp:Transcript_16632/g.33693  ORF Transcript_16632/g.33693 Transcript_16632/m.33693 type:complete len:220 (+) Transcript_16632:137-796(+)